MNKLLVLLALLMLTACRPSEETPAPASSAPPEAAATASESTPSPAEEPIETSGFESDTESNTVRLARVLAAQSPEMRARYDARHPQQTLEFFGITPGMTVVEALPGGGWYSRILMAYLGDQGRLIGANYALEMWPLFPFGTEEFMVQMRQWPEQFPVQAGQWCSSDCAGVDTFWFGSLPERLHDQADVVLFVRALHNLARFNDEHGYLDAALADAYAVLKPGGVFAVVQHEARAEMPDDWAGGDNGYLKRGFVIAQAEAAGFEFEAASEINANASDQPTASDIVWRLAPSYRTTAEGTAEREAIAAIGESNRMTLKFRKPALATEE
jgi:predicted methyltransferase